MKRDGVVRLPAALLWFALSVLALQLSGCELAKGIFKAGFWVGIIVVLAVLGLIGFGISKLRS
jgi:hypothetical protein